MAEANPAETEVVEPLSPTSRMNHEPQLNCHIIAVFGMKVPFVDVEVFKKDVKTKLLKHPRFSSKLAFDATKETRRPIGWVRTEVNVDDHFIVPTLDVNVDEPDKFVEDYLSNLTENNSFMDLSRPLWEFHILNVQTRNCASTIVLRLHHSMGDGVSLISLILACARKTSEPHALPSLPIAKEKKQTLIMNTHSSFGILRYLFAFLMTIKVVYNTLVDAAIFAATIMFLKDTNTPLYSRGAFCFEGNPSPRRFVHRNLSLDDIKLVKNVMDLTVNDVILGITQAGISRYLNKNYGKHKEAGMEAENNMPKHIRLRATVTLNLRPTSTIESLLEMMEAENFKECQWGNKVGYVILPFHISPIDDPLDHIREAKATIDRKKQSLAAQLAQKVYSNSFMDALGIETSTHLTYKALANTTMCFSNVVGPADEISLAGYPLVYIAPTVYGLPISLTIHFLSYMDKMTLSIGVAEDIIPDPDKLCDDIAESLALAKDALLGR